MEAVARGIGGGPGPGLVYVPGIDGSGELLLGTRERLEERFRLLRLAYRDQGSDGYGFLARSVVACLEGAGLERPLLLAESFGVGVALRAALEAPGRVAGLALVNGFARYDRRLRLALARGLAGLCPPGLARIGRPLARSRLFGPRRDADVEARWLALEHPLLDAAYARRLGMIARLDLLPRLGEVRRPVALFASDEDRIVPAVRAAEAMRRALPDATLEVLRGAGHVVLPFPEEPWVARLETLAGRACASG